MLTRKKAIITALLAPLGLNKLLKSKTNESIDKTNITIHYPTLTIYDLDAPDDHILLELFINFRKFKFTVKQIADILEENEDKTYAAH